jgi:hypothetical protein
MPNVQTIYLRLPDSSLSGQVYEANRGESLSKLYQKQIDGLTSTDGEATYARQDLEELVAFILPTREPNTTGILNHKLEITDEKDVTTPSDHVDYVVSVKLVKGVIARKKINATVKS